MGGILGLSLAGLVASVDSFAAPVAYDACQNHCELGTGRDGAAVVFCHCGNGRAHGPTRPSELVRSPLTRLAALRGLPPEAVRAIDDDACQAPVDERRAHPRPAGDFLFHATSGAVPLCDCVSARVHFPLERECHRTGGGEHACSFAVGERPSGEAGPLRDPTLEDYLSCHAQAANFVPGADHTCENAACAPPPACDAGQELYNAATAGACCPKFVCRARPGEGDPHVHDAR